MKYNFWTQSLVFAFRNVLSFLSFLLPLRPSISPVSYIELLNKHLKVFKNYQLGQITKLDIELCCGMWAYRIARRIFGAMPDKRIKTLPRLQRLRTCLFSPDHWRAISFPKFKKIIYLVTGDRPMKDEYEVVLEKMDVSSDEYTAG
jgi:hypothetical protein